MPTLLSFILLELAKSPVPLSPKALGLRYANSRDTISLASACGHVRRSLGANRQFFRRPEARFYGRGGPVSLTDEGRAKAAEIAEAVGVLA